MKKKLNYFLAFLIPFFICLIFLYFKGIISNIEYIYVSDLRLQHIVFLNYLKEIIIGNASLFYTFTAGMGSSMLSTMIFYCISPINILLLIIKDIRWAILFIYIVKVSLAGMTMFILLKNKMGKDNLVTVMFSTCYALCSFAINYFYCVFWFDVLYLAPLVVLGIDRMFSKKKISIMYILSLALAIICNIQMGFGLCVFSVIYFIYSYNINYNIKKDYKKFIYFGIIFAISSLCAGAISSGFLLGFMSSYSDIAAARLISVTTSPGVSNIGYILKNMFTVGNFKTDYYNSFEPFIYCGLIVSFFSILYLFSKNIDKKKRLHALGVIIVFFISFKIDAINLFWHLSSPVLLNFRYSVYLGLFLTMMAYECYITKDKLDKSDITVLLVSLFIGLFIVIGYSNEIYIGHTFIVLVIMFFVIMYVKNYNKKFELLLILLVFVELGLNGYLSVYTAMELPFSKYSSYDSFSDIVSKNDFDDNYRVMYNYSYTDNTNDTLLANKNSSLRYFSSVISGNLITFYNRNGSNVGNNNYRVSAFDSPLLLSLMGNKYFYLTEDFNNGIYKKINTYNEESYDYELKKNVNRDVYLYENPYALSLGYVIGSDYSYREGQSIQEYQNGIIKAFTGNDKNVLIDLDYDIIEESNECQNNSTYYSCREYRIKNNGKKKNIYVYSSLDEYVIPNNVRAYLNGMKPLVLSTMENSVNVVLKYNGDFNLESFDVVTYDEENLINDLDILRDNSMYNISINNNIMTGKLDTNKDGILFLSIPYDNRFKIYVDSKEVDYYPVLDNAFVGLDILKGSHDIKIVYRNEKIYLYVLMSLLSLIITFGLYFFINRKLDKRISLEKEKEETIKINNKKKKK